MKKLVLKTTLFLLIIVIPISIWLMTYGLPPPKFSTSISLNAKIQNIKEKHLGDSIKVLAIGSSMTLNNSHTKTIKKYFSEKYLNISSWGQNIEEDFNLMKIFAKYYKPKTIIISSGYLDFINLSKNLEKKIDYDLIDNYIHGKKLIAYKKTSIIYLIKESKNFFNMSHDKSNYTSLRYDDCGGVHFTGNGFNINQDRWNGNNILKFDIDTNQYHYLDSISHFCEIKGINLIFVQNPYRKGYYLQLNETALCILHAHVNKIDSILKSNNQIFINTENELWDDNLFVDYSHFNKGGAKKYTEYFIKESYKARTHNKAIQ